MMKIVLLSLLVAVALANEGEQESKGCYYYCYYDNAEPYCCGTVEQGIPESHDPHNGLCPNEKNQLCKTDGVYMDFTSKVFFGKKNVLLATKEESETTCASDGYCADTHKCCRNRCSQQHSCLLASPELPTKKKSSFKN